MTNERDIVIQFTTHWWAIAATLTTAPSSGLIQCMHHITFVGPNECTPGTQDGHQLEHYSPVAVGEVVVVGMAALSVRLGHHLASQPGYCLPAVRVTHLQPWLRLTRYDIYSYTHIANIHACTHAHTHTHTRTHTHNVRNQPCYMLWCLVC